MSSTSEYDDTAWQPSSRESSSQPAHSPPAPRRQSQARDAPRKHTYKHAYRQLYNAHVARAVARFDTDGQRSQSTKYVGASPWSAKEQDDFYAALARLGRSDVAGIAAAIGTKSIPETQALLLLFHHAASQADTAPLKPRDIPAAFDVGSACGEQLELQADALAWYEERCDAYEEEQKYGPLWLITPQVAAQIEGATETPRRGGRGIVGACTACKRFKQKCDRETPCGNCQRRKKNTECIYPQQQQPAKRVFQDKKQAMGADPLIPEATLLKPRVMLALSKTLFMNPSPTVPYPWAHWSEYTSDLAREPSMYRSALKTFHALVVSVTKRLVQTALIQATSRLRAQRYRVDRNNRPFVKRQDVRTAIDILRMKRDGRERWRGVVSRCGLEVYDEDEDEEERVGSSMSPRAEPQTERKATDAAEQSQVETSDEDIDSSSSSDEGDDEDDLEHFDHATSRHEEQALCTMLDLEPTLSQDQVSHISSPISPEIPPPAPSIETDPTHHQDSPIPSSSSSGSIMSASPPHPSAPVVVPLYDNNDSDTAEMDWSIYIE